MCRIYVCAVIRYVVSTKIASSFFNIYEPGLLTKFNINHAIQAISNAFSFAITRMLLIRLTNLIK